jgi:hypothetical protein
MKLLKYPILRANWRLRPWSTQSHPPTSHRQSQEQDLLHFYWAQGRADCLTCTIRRRTSWFFRGHRPLSPIEVKKILFPAPEADNHRQSTDNRGQGHYHPATGEPEFASCSVLLIPITKFLFKCHWVVMPLSPVLKNQLVRLRIVQVKQSARP